MATKIEVTELIVETIKKRWEEKDPKDKWAFTEWCIRNLCRRMLASEVSNWNLALHIKSKPE